MINEGEVKGAEADAGLAPKRQTQTTSYDDRFFDQHEAGMLTSARVVVPILLDLFPAKHVVDFGCGRGAWLRVFLEAGVEDVLGVDGNYLNRSKLLIDPGRFLDADMTQPVRLDRRFDLALCLEVAEHLPPSSSYQLVQSLTAAAPVIVFSAAIPGQPGTHHVNVQWPGFWRNVFADFGYRRLDLIRPLILVNRDVRWWYRQNIFLFATDPAIAQLRDRGLVSENVQDTEFEIIHTDILNKSRTLSGLFCEIPRAIVRSIRARDEVWASTPI